MTPSFALENTMFSLQCAIITILTAECTVKNGKVSDINHYPFVLIVGKFYVNAEGNVT